ncbi:MAG: hypothetical protein HKN16_06235 [Saprospiraceae bacterium]|nr:hypothetical protein [Saprospiraceae bacterium]
MIKSHNFLLSIIILFGISCNQSEVQEIHVLSGTWKVEGKNVYEEWQANDGGLVGKGYSLIEGEKLIRETLSIRPENGSIIYTATVPNQNEGASIPFILNPSIDSLLSFENPEHDFPKKIQYKPISDNQIDVRVLGEGDQGFSQVLKRVSGN